MLEVINELFFQLAFKIEVLFGDIQEFQHKWSL